ncbi:MAG: methyltransferase domain-containing protein [Sulfuriferula sp.]|nr:methyltransferase domain-containing protein [Sulfuriferula sp.]
MRTMKWNAEDYAQHSTAQLQWAQELIAKLALQGNESVLDIGCGDGKISAQLAQTIGNGNVVGIDLSADMIRLAATQFPPERYANLRFLHMDAADIRLTAGFDIAFSNAALHWVADHRAVLQGARRCLKTGGRIVLQMGGRGNASAIFDTVQTIMQQPAWLPYFTDFTAPYHFYGPEDYAAWLPENGFRPQRMALLEKDMQHAGIDGLTGWLRTTWFPYTDRLPVELRDTFLAEVVATYIAAHPVDARGNTHVKMVRLEVEAYAL